MWMMGGRPGIGSSWTMAKEGEATSRGSAPNSAAMTRARKVFPAPRSPTRWTTASGFSSCAMARPAAAVSDSVRQRNCCTAGLSQPLNRHRQLLRQVERGQSRIAVFFQQEVAGEAVQIDGSDGSVEGVEAAGEERRDHAAEDVAHAAGGHAGIAGGIDADVPFRVGDEGLVSFQHDDAVAETGGVAGRVDAVGVDVLRL